MLHRLPKPPAVSPSRPIFCVWSPRAEEKKCGAACSPRNISRKISVGGAFPPPPTVTCQSGIAGSMTSSQTRRASSLYLDFQIVGLGKRGWPEIPNSPLELWPTTPPPGCPAQQDVEFYIARRVLVETDDHVARSCGPARRGWARALHDREVGHLRSLPGALLGKR